MKPIANAVDDLFQPRELAEDEYLNEADGLIYCSKCHTPKQHRIELKERVFLPTVRCRCQQEEYDKEEAERKHQEFLLQVSRLKANEMCIRDSLHKPDIRPALRYDTDCGFLQFSHSCDDHKRAFRSKPDCPEPV